MAGYVGGPRSKGFQTLSQLGIEVVVDSTALENLKDKLKLSTIGLRGTEVGGLADLINRFSGLSTILGGLGGVALGAFTHIANGFKTLVADPMTRFFKSELRTAVQDSANIIREELVAAIPLTLTNQIDEIRSAFGGVAREINRAGMESVILPKELAKLSPLYTKLAKESGGMAEYFKRLSTLSEMTGMNAGLVNDLLMDWSQAFNIGINPGAQDLANITTGIMGTTGATLQDLKMIATWLMPYMATMSGDSLDNLKQMLAVAGALAERGAVTPLFMRGIDKFFSQLTAAGGEMVALLASENVQLYEAEGRASSLMSNFQTAGKELGKLYKEQDKLTRSIQNTPGAAQAYVDQLGVIEDKITNQRALVEGIFEAMSRSGAKIKQPIELFRIMNTILEKNGSETAAWGRIISQVAKGSGASIIGVAAQSSGRMQELYDKVSDANKDFSQETRKMLEQGSDHWQRYAYSSWKILLQTFTTALGEPFRKAFYEGTYNAVTGMNTALQDNQSRLSQGLQNINQAFTYIAESSIKPTIETLGSLITEAFSPSPDLSQIDTLQTRLRSLMMTGFVRASAVAEPIVQTLSQVLGQLLTTAITAMDLGQIANFLGVGITKALWSGFSGFLKGVGGPGGAWLRKQFSGVSQDTVKELRAATNDWTKGFFATADLEWGKMRGDYAKFLTGGDFDSKYGSFFQKMSESQAAPGDRALTFEPLDRFREALNTNALWTEMLTKSMGDIQTEAKQAGLKGLFQATTEIPPSPTISPTPVQPVRQLSIAELLAAQEAAIQADEQLRAYVKTRGVLDNSIVDVLQSAQSQVQAQLKEVNSLRAGETPGP